MQCDFASNNYYVKMCFDDQINKSITAYFLNIMSYLWSEIGINCEHHRIAKFPDLGG